MNDVTNEGSTLFSAVTTAQTADVVEGKGAGLWGPCTVSVPATMAALFMFSHASIGAPDAHNNETTH